MSVRRSIIVTRRVHVYRDVTDMSLCIDLGSGSYNRSWRIWPRPFSRVY